MQILRYSNDYGSPTPTPEKFDLEQNYKTNFKFDLGEKKKINIFFLNGKFCISFAAFSEETNAVKSLK